MLPHWCNFLLSFQSLCWELKLKFSPSCCLQLYKLSDSYLTVFKDSAFRVEWQMKLQHVACTLSQFCTIKLREQSSVILSYSITAYNMDLAWKIPDAIPDSKLSALGFWTTVLWPLIYFVCGCTNGNIIMRELSSVNKNSFLLKHCIQHGSSMENTTGMYVDLQEDRMTTLDQLSIKSGHSVYISGLKQKWDTKIEISG